VFRKLIKSNFTKLALVYWLRNIIVENILLDGRDIHHLLLRFDFSLSTFGRLIVIS